MEERRSEEKAFRDDLVALLPQLKRYAVSLTRNAISAEDLVSDTVIQAMSSWRKFEPGTNLKGWTFAIQVGLFRNQLRKAVRHGRDVPIEDAGFELAMDGSQYEAVRLREAQRAIESLPAEQRAVLLLCISERKSYSEVAEELGCEVGTVKSRLNRARLAVDLALNAEAPRRQRAP